jgi:hypothetical protein
MKPNIKFHITFILVAMLSLQLHAQETLTKDSDRFIFNTKTGEVLIAESAAMTFDTKTPVVEVIAPDGGEHAGHATPLAVGWSATDETLAEYPVSVYLLTEAGTVSYTLAELIPNSGSELFNLPPEAVGLAKIRITATDAFGNVGEDMSNDFFTITCQSPEEITVVGLTENTALLEWEFMGTGPTYDLLYGFAGFDPLTEGMLVQGISETGYQLTDLLPSTAYQCYVRTVCGETPGLWSIPAAFTTLSGEEHTVCIPEGWSIISSYNQPDNPALESIFEGLNAENKVVIMIGDGGIYWPAQNVNSIGNWNVYRGYKIKMNSAGCVQIDGTMPENKTIAFGQGASYLPVLCDQPVPVEDILLPLGADLLIAFDLHSHQIYWPMGGLFTLEYLAPGKGYLINMTAPRDITFNCSKATHPDYEKAAPPVYADAPWNVNKTGSAHFVAIAGEALAHLEIGDYVGVFDMNGHCFGLTRYEDTKENLLLLAYGNDVSTPSLDGFSANEQMQFAIYKQSGKETVPVEAIFSNTFPHSDLFVEMGQTMITGFKAGASGIADGGMSVVSLHPNPNDGQFVLELPASSHSTGIEVITATGVSIHAVTLAPSDQPVTHPLVLGNTLPGVYFVRITTQDEIIVKKVVVR